MVTWCVYFLICSQTLSAYVYEFVYMVRIKQKRKIVGEWKITAFLKCIPLLIQEGCYSYVKKSEAEKYRGRRVKYDCHNNYRQSSTRALCEKNGMKTFAIRTSGRQKEKFMQLSYAKKMAVGKLQLRLRITQVLSEYSDCVYFVWLMDFWRNILILL